MIVARRLHVASPLLSRPQASSLLRSVTSTLTVPSPFPQTHQRHAIAAAASPRRVRVPASTKVQERLPPYFSLIHRSFTITTTTTTDKMTDKLLNLVPDVIKKVVTQDFGFNAVDVPNLSGKTAIVTGGTNGIGLSLSRTLYAHDARVIIISSQSSVGEKALEYIKTGDLSKAPEDYAQGFGKKEDDTSGEGGEGEGGEVEWVKCDFKDLKEVAKVGKELGERVERIDYFYGLAGIGVAAFERTSAGYDSHLTINCLSEHLLLSHLWSTIKSTSSKAGTDVRVITMASEMHRSDLSNATFKDTEEFKKDVGALSLYSRTKLGNILFAKAISQRHVPSTSSILVLATHPGAVATGQQSQFSTAYGAAGDVLAAAVRPVMRHPDKGASSALWAGFSMEPRSEGEKWRNGDYVSDPGEDGKESGQASKQENIDNFYVNSEKIIMEVVGKEGYGKW